MRLYKDIHTLSEEDCYLRYMNMVHIIQAIFILSTDTQIHINKKYYSYTKGITSMKSGVHIGLNLSTWMTWGKLPNL